jgi:hypothetical protein
VQPAPGRSCPIYYRYAPDAFACAPIFHADTLWIAGGLYGNPYAFQALLDAYVADSGSKALVFNGDFHWFDVAPEDFELVDETVLGFHAIRGNVETEIAAPGDGAGCGCAYPDWVGEATVAHSNRIIERLRATARSSGRDLRALAALPMHFLAEVGGERVGIVHGDATSLAGWNFSQEVLSTAAGRAQAELDFERAGVGIFASSHTCLPVLHRSSKGRILVNNGAAGMPNFCGERYGLATRISVSASSAALYRARCGNTFVEAIPLRYDAKAWEQRFVAQWPPGSDAHRSYFERIRNGPDYALRNAA